MKTTVREGCVPDDTRPRLTRTDVAALAACVGACNDGGVYDALLAKLRGLWARVGDGLALPEVSAKAVGERAASPERAASAGAAILRASAPSRPVSPPAGADYPTMRELEYEPGAPDTVVVDETAVENLAKPTARASTVEAVAAGVAAAEREAVEPELSFRPRRVPTTGTRRRTRATNE